jgi:hypothetical protein
MRGLRAHLTYANVMVTLLAFVVLCGGTAYAVDQLGKESVGARQLKKNAVTSAKVKDGSLRPKDIKGLMGTPMGIGIPGPAGPSGAGPAYQAHGEVNYDVISSSLYGSRVVSLPLPQGSYFAIAAVTVQSVNSTGDTVQCRLLDGVGGAGTQAVIQRSQWARADQNVDAFTLTGAFAVGAGEGLDLQCSKSNPVSGARITDASIVAVQVTGITGQAQ